MKRKYSKPEIIFENFSLNTHIAGNCAEIITNAGVDQCGYEMSSGITVFISEVPGCTHDEPDGNYNGLCYHVPTDDSDLFNS